ncbi:MAG: restriction endonuclease subunit S [Acidimicrobiales bacterium]
MIRQVPFLDLLSNIVDNRGRTCPTSDSGLPLIATNCIANDALFPIQKKVRYVSEETYRNWFRGHPRPGDIIFVCKGSPGNVAMAPDPVGFCIAQDMVAVRANPDLVYPRYLFAALRSRSVRAQIERLHVGTLIPHFKKGDFDKLLIPVPDRSAQQFIGDLYYFLSAKMEASRKVADLADASWQAILADAGLEHDRVPLSALGRFINGKAFTKGASGTGRMVVRIAELNSGPGGSTVYNDIAVADENTARPGDLLFAWSGSLTIQRWFRPEAIINQHIFKVVPQDGVPAWFLHGRLLELLPFFQGIAAGKATTMGHIQRHHLDEMVSLPLASTMSELDRVCGPLWETALLAEEQSLGLAQLRDALLPGLMSGELKSPDIEGRAPVPA